MNHEPKKKIVVNLFERKAGTQDCPFYLEASKGYKSALDDITGHYLFGTTESRNNLQVNKAPFTWFWTLKVFRCIFFLNKGSYTFIFKKWFCLMQRLPFTFDTNPKLYLILIRIGNVQKINLKKKYESMRGNQIMRSNSHF